MFTAGGAPPRSAPRAGSRPLAEARVSRSARREHDGLVACRNRRGPPQPARRRHLDDRLRRRPRRHPAALDGGRSDRRRCGRPTTRLVFLLCVFSAARLGALLGGADVSTSRSPSTSSSTYGSASPAVVQLDADYFHFPEYFLGRGFDQSTRITATTIIWTGVLAYEVGLRLGRRQSEHAPRPPPAAAAPGAAARRPVGLASSALALVLGGSAAVLFTTRQEFYDAFGTRAEGGYATLASEVALRLPIFVAAVLLVYLYRQPGGLSWPRAPLARRPLVVSVGCDGIRGQQHHFEHPRHRRRARVRAAVRVAPPASEAGQRLAFVAILVGVFFVYPLANSFRRADRSMPGPEPTARPVCATSSCTPAASGCSRRCTPAVEYVDASGLHLRAASCSVPRSSWSHASFWADKPVDTGDMMHDALGYPPQLNESSPLWTEFYIDGGFPLVVIGFAAYGALTRSPPTPLRRAPNPSRSAPSSFPLLAGYQLYILRGSLLSATPRLAVLVALVFRPRLASGPPRRIPRHASTRSRDGLHGPARPGGRAPDPRASQLRRRAGCRARVGAAHDFAHVEIHARPLEPRARLHDPARPWSPTSRPSAARSRSTSSCARSLGRRCASTTSFTSYLPASRTPSHVCAPSERGRPERRHGLHRGADARRVREQLLAGSGAAPRSTGRRSSGPTMSRATASGRAARSSSTTGGTPALTDVVAPSAPVPDAAPDPRRPRASPHRLRRCALDPQGRRSPRRLVRTTAGSGRAELHVLCRDAPAGGTRRSRGLRARSHAPVAGARGVPPVV